MKKIVLSGGFHNAARINLRIKDNALSEGQYKRLNKHMCGVDRCICGWRGYDLEGIDYPTFSEMIMNVSYQSMQRKTWR
jgi:hypothetical protein